MSEADDNTLQKDSVYMTGEEWNDFVGKNVPDPDAGAEKKKSMRERIADAKKDGRLGGPTTSASKNAPKNAPKKPAVRVAAAKPGEFVDDLTALYTMLGVVVTTKDKECGPAIVQAAPSIAEEWDKLAAADPKVRKALRSLTKGSAWGGVIMAHLPILMIIGQHHAPILYGKKTENESVSDSSV